MTLLQQRAIQTSQKSGAKTRTQGKVQRSAPTKTSTMLGRACFSNFKRREPDEGTAFQTDTKKQSIILQVRVFYSGACLSFRKLLRQQEPKTVSYPIRLCMQWDQQNIRLAGRSSRDGRQEPQLHSVAGKTPASPCATTDACHHNHSSSGENSTQHKPGKTNFASPESRI